MAVAGLWAADGGWPSDGRACPARLSMCAQIVFLRTRSDFEKKNFEISFELLGLKKKTAKFDRNL